MPLVAAGNAGEVPQRQLDIVTSFILSPTHDSSYFVQSTHTVIVSLLAYPNLRWDISFQVF